ncbi:MAG: vanadium-dependent haloperoxidase, partial [Candidatus Omnitrophica bacterium]|nr:vanadium-dependent haloperoxidase [Candidatus Omnitrophota bacterium]
DNGVALGQTAADMILAHRALDGSTDTVSHTPGSDPGDWRPTPPGFAPALLPNWPTVLPWAMLTGDQFRITDGLPTLDSPEYETDFNEVKSLGRMDSVMRTADQTEIALFWANGAGTETPPGHWNRIAANVSESRGLALLQNARLFALLNIALADAAIVSWDHKYAFNFWRPVTAIREADTDGNPATIQDATWTPLLATPPFPTYTSGHSTFSGAAERVLARFFGSDTVPFRVNSDGLPGIERSYASFSQAADESGRSRIYGGIHFEFDNRDGLASGRDLGDFVMEHYLHRLRVSADLNEDGVVNATDLILFQESWHQNGQ